MLSRGTLMRRYILLETRYTLFAEAIISWLIPAVTWGTVGKGAASAFPRLSNMVLYNKRLPQLCVFVFAPGKTRVSLVTHILSQHELEPTPKRSRHDISLGEQEDPPDSLYRRPWLISVWYSLFYGQSDV
jgi:hypothetical protein